MELPDDLGRRLRDAAYARHGGRQHGSLKRAMVEAVEDWLAKRSEIRA